jgi:hypothetical protein
MVLGDYIVFPLDVKTHPGLLLRSALSEVHWQQSRQRNAQPCCQAALLAIAIVIENESKRSPYLDLVPDPCEDLLTLSLGLRGVNLSKSLSDVRQALGGGKKNREETGAEQQPWKSD